VLAIIPARGGSKGLPGKNIRPLNGKPLISYSIEAALKASSITRVICSTDSLEIADVAKLAGADIPFLRPPELAEDNSLAIDNYIYTVDRLNSLGMQIEEYCVLLPTAPLRIADDIDAAAKIFYGLNADSVISYYPAPHPIQWHKYINEFGALQSFFDKSEQKLANRQEERQSYLPNGAIYIFRHSLIKSTRQYYSSKTFPYLMPISRSVDIDTIDDFKFAEYLIKNAS
jgi:CMP-N,N'-diacetyllegionaminic acid synthase